MIIKTSKTNRNLEFSPKKETINFSTKELILTTTKNVSESVIDLKNADENIQIDHCFDNDFKKRCKRLGTTITKLKHC